MLFVDEHAVAADPSQSGLRCRGAIRQRTGIDIAPRLAFHHILETAKNRVEYVMVIIAESVPRDVIRERAFGSVWSLAHIRNENGDNRLRPGEALRRVAAHAPILLQIAHRGVMAGID